MKTEFEKELEIKEAYDAMLDEVYTDVKIGYSTFTASEILFNCDPVMYHQGLLDYTDSIEKEQGCVGLTNVKLARKGVGDQSYLRHDH